MERLPSTRSDVDESSLVIRRQVISPVRGVGEPGAPQLIYRLGEKPVMLDHIDREIELLGPLSDADKAKLLEIADKCPVHRTLTSKVLIDTRLA